MRRGASVVGLLTAVLMLSAGCGGNPFGLPFYGGGGDSAPQTVRIDSKPAIDGMVFSNGSVVTAGGSPLTGDLDATLNGVSSRQFFHFDLSSIPANATIDSAQLYVEQVGVLGTPYTTHGAVVVEEVDFGAGLDAGDFALPALGSAGTLSTSLTLGSRSLDVTARIAGNFASGRRLYQPRLRFSVLDSDVDGVSDAARFGDAESSAQPNSAPYLLVTYTGP